MTWAEQKKKEIDKLFESVEQKLSISKDDLISSSRKEEFVLGRKLFMNILYDSFISKEKVKQKDVAEIVNRDRVSFIHNRKQHLNHLKSDKKYKELFEEIKKMYDNK